MIENIPVVPLQELGDGVTSRLINDINGLLPHILYAVVIGVIGFVVATLVEGWVSRFVNRLDAATQAQDSTIGELFLSDRRRLGDLLGLFAKVYVYLLTAFLVASELQLGRVANSLDGVIGFLPTAAVTLVVLAFGFWLADIVNERVSETASADGQQLGEVFGLAVQVFVYVIAIVVGFSVLAGTSGGAGFAIPIMQVFALGFALAFVLAVGWGAKEYIDTDSNVVPADD